MFLNSRKSTVIIYSWHFCKIFTLTDLEESKNAYSVVGGDSYTVPTVGRGSSGGGGVAEREYSRSGLHNEKRVTTSSSMKTSTYTHTRDCVPRGPIIHKHIPTA